MGRDTAATDQPSQDGHRRALPASLFPEKSRPSSAPGRPPARLQGGRAAALALRPIPAQRSLPSAAPIGCQLPGRGCQRRVWEREGECRKRGGEKVEKMSVWDAEDPPRAALIGRTSAAAAAPWTKSPATQAKGWDLQKSGRGKRRLRPLDALGLSPPTLAGGRPRPFSGEPYCGMFTSALLLPPPPLQIRATPGQRGSRASAPSPVQPSWERGGG